MRRAALAVSALVSLAMLVGCGLTTGAPAGPTTVHVTLKEFSVGLDTQSARSGTVTFDIKNSGTVAHEFVVVKTDLSDAALPMDGSTVSEAGGSLSVVDEAEDIAPGATATLKVDLKPGKYVVMCNVEGHYMGGMHATIQVS